MDAIVVVAVAVANIDGRLSLLRSLQIVRFNATTTIHTVGGLEDTDADTVLLNQ